MYTCTRVYPRLGLPLKASVQRLFTTICTPISRHLSTDRKTLVLSEHSQGLSRFQCPPNVPLDQHMSQTIQDIQQGNAHQEEFWQAVDEVFWSLKPLFKMQPELVQVFRLLTEPERVLIFRVPWIDRNGIQRYNRGFRIQHSSILGPYKGGLRFHPSVTLSVMKFLAFEQTFKNSLTHMPMGGAKGGADFDPKGKTDHEIMMFCQSFMTELHKYIGPNMDVPAGDINVGAREIGYLYGQYKRLTNRFEGALTAKGILWGGSYMRPEATGYGAAFFAHEWCRDHNVNLQGVRCAISGSGNVALYAGRKLRLLGAKPITFSDTGGTLYEPQGFDLEQINKLFHLKFVLNKRLKDYSSISSTAQYFESMSPWNVPTDITLAFPCATQNELDISDAQNLIRLGCRAVIEGSNMPTTPKAIAVLKQHGVGLLPSKASNAGGVAVSGLEMAQNSMRTTWSAQVVEEKLKDIMSTLYKKIKWTAQQYTEDPSDFISGANISAFLNLSAALIQQGSV